jgi:predicted Mrr-cat superfamily restriction endonuclease
MSNSQNNSLNSTDICAILRACREAGVSELEFGTLRVTLGKTARIVQEEAAQSLATETEISAHQVKQAREAFELDELRMREDQLAELLITDPARAEQMLIDGELEDVTDGEPDEPS